jgi:hypothetical protein
MGVLQVLLALRAGVSVGLDQRRRHPHTSLSKAVGVAGAASIGVRDIESGNVVDDAVDRLFALYRDAFA